MGERLLAYREAVAGRGGPVGKGVGRVVGAGGFAGVGPAVDWSRVGFVSFDGDGWPAAVGVLPTRRCLVLVDGHVVLIRASGSAVDLSPPLDVVKGDVAPLDVFADEGAAEAFRAGLPGDRVWLWEDWLDVAYLECRLGALGPVAALATVYAQLVAAVDA